MRQLNHDLKTLLAKNPERGHVTRRDRSYILDQVADILHELGFLQLRSTGLRRRHVNALVAKWKRKRLSVGTLKNRMAATPEQLYLLANTRHGSVNPQATNHAYATSTKQPEAAAPSNLTALPPSKGQQPPPRSHYQRPTANPSSTRIASRRHLHRGGPTRDTRARR